MNHSVSKWLLLVLFFGYYDFNYCIRMLKVIPGMPTITYVDSNYVEDVSAKTRRNGRKSDYVLNIEFTNKHTWTNDNVSVHMIMYEYLHNEYRRSFFEMHFKLCDLILKDPYVGRAIRSVGLTVCPILPGRKYLPNITFNYQFPSILPFEKGKGDLIAKLQPSGKVFYSGDLVLTFKMKE